MLASQFFALSPPDNVATIAPGADVEFPQDGPTTAAGAVTRLSASSFVLTDIGVYRVSFQVPVTEAGQLVVTIDGVELASTVTGRFTGTTPIIGTVLVETTVVNSVLTLRNPAGSSLAFQVTPMSGGTSPSSATLLIERIG